MERPARFALSLTALLLAFAGALLAAALLHERPVPPGPSLAAVAVRETPTVARRVEKIRGLRFDTIPRPRIATSAVLARADRRASRRPAAQRQLRAGEAEAKLLGLLPPGSDLSALESGAAQLAAAAYVPASDRLYVLRDAVPANQALIEFVLSHELTHALEDQRFGLKDVQDTSDDGALARLALAEGTATAVMTDYARRYLDPLALAGSAAGLDASTHGVPPFVIQQLDFAYLRGAAFVDALRAETGSWNLVNIAVRERPPASTEQVMHPEKYLLDERPLPVSLHGNPGPGWHPVDGGTVGEFTTFQLLDTAMPAGLARAAASGWGGDSYRLWSRGPVTRCRSLAECRSRYALLIAWRWDSAAGRNRFEQALRRYATVVGADVRDRGGTVLLVAGDPAAQSRLAP
jgi:hypothetical protein